MFLQYSNFSLSRVRDALLMKIITKKLQRVNCHVYHNGITENIYSLEENEIARIMRYQLFCYQQMAVNNCLTLVVSCIFITLVPWFISLYFSMIFVVRSLHHFLTTCSRVWCMWMWHEVRTGLVSLQLYFTSDVFYLP